MARSSSPRPAATVSPAPAPDGKDAPSGRESYRETVEAIVVAFILALLVRGFEFEAFVIPTGSMAPTLMGRHKEIDCPQCGYRYAVNASEEEESYPGGRPVLRRVASGVCVNCRYQAKLAGDPSFKGDRILVMKFPYDLPKLPGSSAPDRWDVVVFRYPEDPEVSYIKRLVGLPGETLKIWSGDVFVKAPGASGFTQARKPLAHQRAMLMTVYDDRYRPASLKGSAEWRRWSPASEGAWTEDEANAPGTFSADGKGGDWAELRYRHLVPDPLQWAAVQAGDPLPRPVRPTLVTDFYSYNTNLSADNSDLTGHVTRDQEGAWLQPHWVGDLALLARVDSEGSSGSVSFELVEGGVRNRCVVDLANGEAVVTHGGAELGRGPTALKGSGRHAVEFANVDNRLALVVDGRPAFGDGLTYEDDADAHPVPTKDDLSPAAVAARGAAVRVSGLVLKRDIYYTVYPGKSDYGSAYDDRMPKTPTQLFDLLAEPSLVAAFYPLGSIEYAIRDDHFLMLGDNSPRSKDSRGWEVNDHLVPGDPKEDMPDRGWDTSNRQAWEVPRNMLTGKAFCIYWPHGVPFWPRIKLSTDLVVPFRPQFERMGLIH